VKLAVRYVAIVKSNGHYCTAFCPLSLDRARGSGKQGSHRAVKHERPTDLSEFGGGVAHCLSFARDVRSPYSQQRMNADSAKKREYTPKRSSGHAPRKPWGGTAQRPERKGRGRGGLWA